jgi:hypothetical protein
MQIYQPFAGRRMAALPVPSRLAALTMVNKDKKLGEVKDESK